MREHGSPRQRQQEILRLIDGNDEYSNNNLLHEKYFGTKSIERCASSIDRSLLTKIPARKTPVVSA
jgi:hypothetical protein